MSDTSYATAPESVATGSTDKKPEVSEERKALVKQWCKDIKASRDHFADAFKRMRTCMTIAAEGAEDKSWIEGDKYTVPIINRHINQAVATLYARNPKAIAKRKAKLLYQVWDGDPQSLQAAQIAMQPPVDPLTGQPAAATDPATGTPAEWQPDPNAMAIIAEVQQVKQTILMYDRLGKTLQLLFQYFMEEQDAGYLEQIKAMVRRAKVCGVAYVKLGFQRQLKKNPDVEAQIADVTSQVARIEALMQQAADPDFIAEENPKVEELRLMLADLQSKVEVIVREGPVLSFPKATEIIVDKKCRHLKTLTGAGWVAHEFDKTTDEVLEDYGVTLNKGDYTGYRKKGDEDKKEADCQEHARLWEVQDKKRGQTFVVCDGYCDFLKEPAEPDVKIERFWTIFPLVFNEIESEDQLYPPSDVWNSRHLQKEYNSSREALREHRIASRPRYAAPKGKLEDEDKSKLASGSAHSILELQGMVGGDKILDLLQRVPSAPIDPNLYEVESVFQDIQRSVGSQEANLGGTAGATATESSIAENSRMTASADNTDDLDTLLANLAKSMGQLMLLELDIDTVREIAGPGAVWPQMPPKREEIVKDLHLTIEAGSSGRPNKAAELANYERAAPWLMQMPGLNPIPFLKRGLDLLEIDLEDAIVEGLPSITAMNQMAGKPAPAASDDPNAQGGQGGDNAEKPGGKEQGSQPAYAPPGPGTAPMAAQA